MTPAGGTAHREAARAARRRALDVLRPTREETLLLRAILWPGRGGDEAWGEWRDRVVTTGGGAGGLPENAKALLPLLHCALRERRRDVDGEFASYARAAHVREELRGQAYRRILGELLDAAASAGVHPVILGGEALARTVYRNPEARHSHGIRFLVPAEEAELFVSFLPGLGCRPVRLRTPGVLAQWTHPSGLPLEMRTRLLAPPHDGLPAQGLHARSVALPDIHPHMRILHPEDELLRVLGQPGTSPGRQSLRWACDAWLLVDRHGERLDWDRIGENVRKAELSLAFSVTLGYLARELDGRVPPTALESVQADAENADDLSLEVAILGALPGSLGHMMHIVRTTPGVRPRAALLRILLFPSPAALRATRPDGPGAPLAYVSRPLGLIGRRTTIWLRGGLASCSRSARAAISGRIARRSSHRSGMPPSR